MDVPETLLEMKQDEFVVHEPSEQVVGGVEETYGGAGRLRRRVPQPPACSPAGASHTEAVYRKSTALFVAIRLLLD